MIGSSVVPGLPNRCVTPSFFSNSRNAERPVMRFIEALPFPRASPSGRRHHDRLHPIEPLHPIALPKPQSSPDEVFGKHNGRQRKNSVPKSRSQKSQVTPKFFDPLQT